MALELCVTEQWGHRARTVRGRAQLVSHAPKYVSVGVRILVCFHLKKARANHYTKTVVLEKTRRCAHQRVLLTQEGTSVNL